MKLSWKYVALFLVLCSGIAAAQVATGVYPYGTFDNPGPDTINVGNLNVHLDIPVLNKAGRGMPFTYDLSFDNSIWYPMTVNGTKSWTPVQNFGWRGITEIATGYVSYSIDMSTEDQCTITTYSNFVYHDSFGVSHSIAAKTQRAKGINCPSIPTDSEVATDGSGLTLNVTNYTTTSIQTPRGKSIAVPATSNGAAAATDSNGNQISVDGNGHFTDTTGNVVLTVAGTPGGSNWTQTFTYKDTSGNPQEVKVNYAQETVATNFGCSGITEFPATPEYLVSSVVLGDGVSTYRFAYEKLSSGYYTGRLNTVTLPQGGVITYTYSGANGGVECADGSTNEVERVIAANSGSAASTWTYTRTQPNGTGTSHTEFVDSMLTPNYKEYDFVLPAPSDFAPGTYYETNRQIYQGAKSGTPVLAQSTCYNANISSCLTTLPSLPISQFDTYATFNGTETDGITSKYDTYGNLTESDVYDFGSSGSRGSALRKEQWAYGYSLPGVPTGNFVYDGSGNPAAKTIYAYDQTTPTPSSGVPQHESVSGPRGNLTTQTVYASSGTSYAATNIYEDTGSLLTSKLTAGSFSGTTTYSYDSTFVYLENELLPTPSSGVAISYGATYDISYTGLPQQSRDPNSEPTKITSYDEMLRPTETQNPDGGYTTYGYENPNQTGVHTYHNSSVYSDAEVLSDGYNRQSRVAFENGQGTNPWYQQDTCYDANGDVNFMSYRYQGNEWSTSKVCSGSDGDTSTYDVLGRLLSVQHGDGTSVTYSYTGRATKVVDEENVTRITQVDGLGRPTIVCEIYSGSALTNSGSPASCGTDILGTGYSTTYAYALSTGTTTVTQGAQTRTFQTDWLGRPIETIEPESGTATYSYAYNTTGLVVTRTRPKANQTGSSTTTTTAQYDSLGRVVTISYSDGTLTKTFMYDVTNVWGVGEQYPKGRLVNVHTGTTSLGQTGSVFSYDSMGRPTLIGECTPSNCSTGNFTVTAGYDWEGNMTQYVDAFGPTYTYAYTKANELISITSNWNDSNHPPDLLSSTTFGPSGPLTWSLGNGMTSSRSYDSMGRVTGGSVVCHASGLTCTQGSTLYSFSIPSGGWAGTYLTKSSDSVTGANSTYSYDAFGRLSTTTMASASFSYVYDRWGNRYQEHLTAGTGPNQTLSFNTANNQVSTSGYTYDKAGNMTDDGLHSYTYDAEGNVTQVDGGQTATYTYDALNHRVRVDAGGSSLEFIFDPQGRKVSDWDPVNKWEGTGWFYWGTTRLGLYIGGTTEFEHQDYLGTERARTQVNGILGTYTSLPFGDGYGASCCDWDPYHFGTLDQDNSANEHAQFREYSNMAGRWFSSDPYQGSYDPANPQSFNRYAYVLNNPLSFFDPTGYCPPAGRNGWRPPCGGGNPSDDDALDNLIFGDPNSAESAYDSFVNAVFEYGPSQIASNGLSYSINWNVEDGAFYVAPNGEAIGPDSVAELGLSTLPGLQPFGSAAVALYTPGGLGGAPNNGQVMQAGYTSYRHKPYYAAACRSAGGILSQLGCPYICIAAESTTHDITLEGVYLWKDQLLEGCPSAGSWCPKYVTIQGTYDPFSGYTNDPEVLSCIQ
jgi:RHS repeat-associated protein